MADDVRNIRVNVTVDSDTRGSDQAAAGLEKIDKSAGKAQGGLADLTKESEKLDVQLAKSKTKLRELEQELIRSADRTTGKGSLRQRVNQERSWLRELERLSKSAAETVVNVGSKSSSSGGGMGRMSLMNPSVIAGISTAVGVAGPALAAMVGGVIAGAIGTVGVAGGLVMAAHNPEVKSAAGAMWDSVQAEFFRGTDAMTEPAIESMAILQKAFQEMKVPEAFALIADEMPVIADGFGDMGKNIMPGFNAALSRMGPYADAAHDGLAGMGSALGDFMDDVTASPGAVLGLRMTFAALSGTVALVGKEIKFASDAFAGVLLMGAKLGQLDIIKILSLGASDKPSKEIQAAFDALGPSSNNATDGLEGFISALRGLGGPTTGAAEAMKQLNDEFERSIDLKASFMLDMLDVEQGLQDLADGFADNGTDLSAFTDVGRDNQRALIGLAREMRGVRDDQINLGTSTEIANAALEANHQRLLDQAEAAGISRAAVELLIGALFAVPTLPFQQTATGYNPETGSRYGGKNAAGGYVSAGSSVLVGEYRPEVFTPATNGYISSSVGAWASGMGGGGGGGTTQVVLSWRPTGDKLLDAILSQIRAEVSKQGGDMALLGLHP